MRVFSVINFDKLEINTHATSSRRVGEQYPDMYNGTALLFGLDQATSSLHSTPHPHSSPTTQPPPTFTADRLQTQPAPQQRCHR